MPIHRAYIVENAATDQFWQNASFCILPRVYPTRRLYFSCSSQARTEARGTHEKPEPARAERTRATRRGTGLEAARSLGSSFFAPAAAVMFHHRCSHLFVQRNFSCALSKEQTGKKWPHVQYGICGACGKGVMADREGGGGRKRSLSPPQGKAAATCIHTYHRTASNTAARSANHREQ